MPSVLVCVLSWHHQQTRLYSHQHYLLSGKKLVGMDERKAEFLASPFRQTFVDEVFRVSSFSDLHLAVGSLPVDEKVVWHDGGSCFEGRKHGGHGWFMHTDTKL